MMQTLAPPLVPGIGERDNVGRLAQLVGEDLQALTPLVHPLSLLVELFAGQNGFCELFQRRRDVSHVRDDPVDNSLVHAELQATDNVGQLLFGPGVLRLSKRIRC